ncbi:MAG TPA: AAA family ATPase [Steroidobacteraceae bacterium]|nr:AAA family ATPase [Steroidobacteraceae bacterium]
MQQKIVVLNPKGGSGKTTIATNLAAYFASQGFKPALLDMDAQGSSSRWLSKRSRDLPPVHGIAGYERNLRVTRSFAMRVPTDCERLIVDTPAAVAPQDLPDLVRAAAAIIVPVLPSDIDIHAATKCIGDLLLIAKVKREQRRLAVVANRVKRHTIMYRSLMRFLESLDIPVITTLRDSQNYVRASESGTGVFEMKPRLVREDTDQWQPLVGWIAQRPAIAMELPSVQAAAPGAANITPAMMIPAFSAASTQTVAANA